MQTWSVRQQAVWSSQHRSRAGHRGCKKYKKYKTTKIRGLSTPMKTKQRQTEGQQKTQLQLSGPRPPGRGPGHSEPGRTERLNGKCS